MAEYKRDDSEENKVDTENEDKAIPTFNDLEVKVTDFGYSTIIKKENINSREYKLGVIPI